MPAESKRRLRKKPDPRKIPETYFLELGRAEVSYSYEAVRSGHSIHDWKLASYEKFRTPELIGDATLHLEIGAELLLPKVKGVETAIVTVYGDSVHPTGDIPPSGGLLQKVRERLSVTFRLPTPDASGLLHLTRSRDLYAVVYGTRLYYRQGSVDSVSFGTEGDSEVQDWLEDYSSASSACGRTRCLSPSHRRLAP